MRRSKVSTSGVAHQRPARVGIILLDASLAPIYISSSAMQIIRYAVGQKKLRAKQIHEAIRSRIIVGQHRGQPVSAKTLISGRRRYLCRELLLQDDALTATSAHCAIILERMSADDENGKPLLEQVNFTLRERQLVFLLAAGTSCKEILRRMSISSRTLRMYAKSLIEKLKQSR